ncbi:Phytoene synthase [Rubellimicrobium mesophilum DSM 19309]|uniref:Phytoene synthase n=1 Tax=Rubellimicrobium mesophilum DSM 19309 TaxID=442562 RepID=A0A017HR29_9RHOB|nr:squalene/phytoene synthase family protein [Rubellimicrobium mesophilum]EYD76947.1 Phytoene synthase [Rubellimicrobium mesophilum DSM 19309]
MTALPAAFAPVPTQEVRRIVETAGSSFAAGMRLLPRRRREAIFAVYAFCRVVDDIADGHAPASEKREALAAWAREIDGVFLRLPRTAVGEELLRAIERYDLPRREFDMILEGMRMDAEGMVAPDPVRLERYVRCVAGAVGLLSMRVFGDWRGDASRRFALSLARGMQLTNILRDVEEDACLGRLYLPAPILEAAGVPPDPHVAWSHPALPEARRQLGRVARLQYGRARAARAGHRWHRILPALVMMGPYERLLSEMEADWTRPPASRPGWRKAADGLACAAGGLAWR